MKTKTNLTPFTSLKLDKEEQAIEESLERGELVDAPNFEATKMMLKEAATRHVELLTSKPVTIRVNQLDLIRVKAHAKARNIPYQTLLGTLIHSFAEGHEKISL